MEKFFLRDSEEYIKLGQVLKAAGLAESGADAKQAVQDGEVMVNEEIDTRRGRKLYDGDIVKYNGKTIHISSGK